MKIKIHGSRGSFPTTRKKTSGFGGNTSCIEIRKDGHLLIVDAGTGILRISRKKIEAEKQFNILLTHLHIDHIQGLGFFNPLFKPDNEVHIWGPAGSYLTLKNRLNRYLSPPLFPVHFRDIPSKTILHEISNTSFKIGPFQIYSDYVSHPGPTVGYRISDGQSVVAYLPDHEPILSFNGWEAGKEWISGMRVAQNVDLLIHDGQYTSEEYKFKIGWGHCSMQNAARFANLAEVKKLLIFHHDPGHTDKILKKELEDLMKESRYNFEIEIAREGAVYKL